VRCYPTVTQCGTAKIPLFFTVADFRYFDQLFTCVNCGAVLAVDADREHYSRVPFEMLKRKLSCPDCGSSLETAAQYPDTFICPDGSVGHYMRGDNSIPPDSESVIVDLWDPYSDLSAST
jgi:rubredoxin